MIDSHVIVASESRIEAHVVLRSHCRIGRQSRVGAHSVVHESCEIGANVTIGSGCDIGGMAFYYVKTAGVRVVGHAIAGVQIGSDVELGSGCTIDRGILRDTVLGDRTKLDNQVHIGHDARLGADVLVAAQTGIAGFADVGDGAVIRGQVGIMQRVRVGAGAVVQGKTGVDQDVGQNLTVFGIPAKTIDRHVQQRRSLIRRIRKVEQFIEETRKHGSELTEQVVRVLADEIGTEPSEIGLDHELAALGLDSLDRASIEIALEEEFRNSIVELRLPEDAFKNVTSVRDIVNAVANSLKVKESTLPNLKGGPRKR